jgi:hypothetical protein
MAKGTLVALQVAKNDANSDDYAPEWRFIGSFRVP